MFSALNDKEMAIVVDAMEEKRYKAGDAVIKEGQDGHELFLVENGTLNCTKIFAGKTEPTFLKQYLPGDAFGELALLYNAPRAATITSETDSLLWCLDRATFNHIVKDASRKRREKYEDFLSRVKILKNMEPYERSVLSDAFVEEKYNAGDFIIKEGEQGDKFYFLEAGEAVATKALSPDEESKEVMIYAAGDYFGERALLKNEPRAANVIAKTDCLVVSVDRHSFKRLMGPLEDIMRRNMELYDQYVREHSPSKAKH